MAPLWIHNSGARCLSVSSPLPPLPSLTLLLSLSLSTSVYVCVLRPNLIAQNNVHQPKTCEYALSAMKHHMQIMPPFPQMSKIMTWSLMFLDFCVRKCPTSPPSFPPMHDLDRRLQFTIRVLPQSHPVPWSFSSS